jgi:hypothetical protein
MNLDTIIAQLIAAHQALSDQQRQLFFSRLAELIHDKSTLESPSSSSSSSFSPSPSSSSESTPPGLLLSGILPQSIQWLWPERLPLGHLTVLEGHSGLGTSLFALTLAAAISSGTPLPGSSSGQQGHVLLITPGLHHAGLLRQRLEAAGADLSRITLLSTVAQPDSPPATTAETPFRLPTHFALLEEAIARLSPSLVIIDPLVLALRSSRLLPDVLSRLAALAERTNCALLLVRHLPAGRTTALTAYASTILRLSGAPGDEQQRLLATVKHTLSAAPAELLLQISGPTPDLPAFQFVADLPAASPGSGELSQQRQTILQALTASPQPLTPHDLARCTGLPSDPLRLLLSRMVAAGEILRPARGLYSSLYPPTSPTHHPSLTALPKSDTSDPFAAILASSRQQAQEQTTSPSSDTSDTIEASGQIDASATSDATGTSDPANASAPSDSCTSPDTSDTIEAPDPTGSTDSSETYIFVTEFPPVDPGPHPFPSFPPLSGIPQEPQWPVQPDNFQPD